jgi:hypothetical protein
VKIPPKKYAAAFLVVLLALAAAVVVVLRRRPSAPEQARSPHEMAHRAKGIAEEAAHDTSQSSAYYQAESTRRMGERLRKLAEEANPETNIYANDKRVLHFKNKTRPPDLWGQLQIDALLATELLYAGQSEEAIQQFPRILVRQHGVCRRSRRCDSPFARSWRLVDCR